MLMEKRRVDEQEHSHLLVFLTYTHSITDALLSLHAQGFNWTVIKPGVRDDDSVIKIR